MPQDADARAAVSPRPLLPWAARASALASRRFVRYALVAVFFAAVAAVWLSPIVRDLGGTMLGEPSDGSGSLREYWAAGAQDETVFTWEHDELATAPEGVPRSPTIAIANAVSPAFALALEPLVGLVAAWNLFLLLGFVLTGLVTFLLLERIGIGAGPSLFGAYVFAFNGFTFEKAIFGHASFVHVWVFPLLVLALLRVRERRDARSALLAGLVTALAFYVGSYFGLLAVVLATVFMAVDLVLSPRGERLWSFTLLDLVYAGALAALSPVLVLWLLNRGEVAALVGNPIQDLQQLGASVGAYLLPSGRHPLLGSLGDQSQQTTSGEPSLFFGYVTIVLALVALALYIWDRLDLGEDTRRIAFFFAAVLVPVAFVVSMPRQVPIFGVDVPMPSYFVGEVVSYWRVYARFGVLVGLGLVVLAAVALAHLARRRGTAVVVAALALAAFELTPGFDVAHWDAGADAAPAHARWLAEHADGIVAYYPEPEEANAYLYLMNREYAFQRVHGHPLYNMWGGGWSGTRTEAIRILSRNPGDPIAPGILAAQGVRYVVALDDVDRGGASVPEFPSGSYEQVASLEGSRIFEVRAEPAALDEVLQSNRVRVAQARGLPSPVVSYGAGFGAPEPWTDGREWRWLEQDGVVAVENGNDAADFELSFTAFSANRPRRLDLLGPDGRVLDSADVPTQAVEVRFEVPPQPAGTTRLTLRATPGPEELGGGDTRVTSVFVSPPSVQPLATYTER